MVKQHYALTDVIINRAYMQDVVETTHIFFKLMEKFCNGNMVVQDKRKSRAKGKKTKKSKKSTNQNGKTPDDEVSRFGNTEKNMLKFYAKQIYLC